MSRNIKQTQHNFVSKPALKYVNETWLRQTLEVFQLTFMSTDKLYTLQVGYL
jgi:hypothetical protein